MKFNVLVFPCGSEIGLEIHQSLKWSTHINLFGASSVSDHGKYIYKNYIGGVPFVNEDTFIDKINMIIDINKIDYIFPAHDSVVKKLANCRDKVHCEIITSNAVTCNICRSKKRTYNLFKGKVVVPKIYDEPIKDKCIFPVFLKPDIGQGSKGTFIAQNYQDVLFYKSKNQSLLILEYLPGDEYTIDCFTDRYGKLRFAGGRKRNRVSNGISVNSYPVNNDNFVKIAQIINNTLKFRGVWFFQLKYNKKGKLTLLEIAPRIAGTMGLYRNLGINFALLSIYDFANINIFIDKNNYSIEVDRSLNSKYKVRLDYNHVYIDFDDCILVNGKINSLVISFLYQCLNNKKSIHLLSKHKGNIESELEKYRIKEIFDDIVQLNDLESKVDYINELPAIFIDDSFSERMKVKEKYDIPVFSVDSIECLLE